LVANGGLNSRIEKMRNYNALSGFIDDELPLFSGKLDFLTAQLSPGNRERTFGRVIRIRELPSFDLNPPGRSFDMESFLEVRAGKESIAFRAWLRNIHNATDDEIREQVASVRTKLAPFVHGPVGKAVRIAISTVSGLVPVYGLPVGLILSVIDSYLLERVFPVSGPTAFLSRQYPSLFEKGAAHS